MPNKERKGRWQAFDALEGYQSALRNTEYEKEKKPKQVLLPDKLEELNLILARAIEEDFSLKVIYYNDGYNKEIIGKLKKVDPINKELIINDKKIKLNTIVDIVESLTDYE